MLDRDGAGVEAVGGEFFAEQHDGGDDFIGGGAGVAGGSSGAGFERIEAAGTIARQQAVEVLARQPVGAGCSSHRQVPADDFQDDHTRFGHDP